MGYIFPLENLVENAIASLNKELINTTINLLIIGRGEVVKTLSVFYITFIGLYKTFYFLGFII